MARPSEMLGEAGGIEPVAQGFEAGEVRAVKRAFAADGQADAVNRDREAGAKSRKLCKGTSAVSHIVFGMDLKPAYRTSILHDLGVMLWLIAEACAQGQAGALALIEHGVSPTVWGGRAEGALPIV